jgi:hypothetical protein
MLTKAAIDYTAATGKAMSAEGLTEAAQQGFERLQAGLSITDAKARKEYFDSFVGGAVLGGAIATPGHLMERGMARRRPQAAKARPTATNNSRPALPPVGPRDSGVPPARPPQQRPAAPVSVSQPDPAGAPEPRLRWSRWWRDDRASATRPTA